MTVILRRISESDLGTFGMLISDDTTLCVTCEDPWNDNQKGISCIPPGTYRCEKFNGTKFKDVWQVMDVPNRSAILIHNGNTTEDTQGCILVGESFTRNEKSQITGITNSRMTLAKLRDTLPDTFTLVVEP